MSEEIRFESDEAERYLARTLTLLEKKRRQLIRDMLAIQLKAITDQMASGPHGGGSVPLGVRTGDARRSFTNPGKPIFSGEDGGPQLSGATGSNLEYLAIQNDGGEITPKNSKFLSVPLPAALTPKGVEKPVYAAMRRGHKLAWRPVASGSGKCGGLMGIEKEVANTPANRFRAGLAPLKRSRFVGKVSAGAQNKGTARKVRVRKQARVNVFTALYALMKSVTIKPTYFADIAFENSEPDVRAYAEKTVTGWWGGGA